MILYPYKPASESSKALADALGIKRISHRNSKFKGAAEKLVINWGASELPEEILKCTVLNTSKAVSVAANKLKFFEVMNPKVKKDLKEVTVRNLIGQQVKLRHDHGYVDGLSVGDKCHIDPDWVVVHIDQPDPLIKEPPRTPSFTTNVGQAYSWLEGGFQVVARTILNGNSGAGIVLLSEDRLEEFVVQAPLYVKYVPKKQEYRVHVFRNEVVDVQRKARRHDVEDKDVNWKIRNHSNGFIFARGEALGDVPEDVLKQSKLAVAACGLDFGAVDVIFSDKEQAAYVLEINSAPGLSGATLEGYVQRFRELMQ